MDRWQEDLLYNGDLRRDLNLAEVAGGDALSDSRYIALDLIKDTKYNIQLLATALPVCRNNELRSKLLSQFNSCVQEYYQMVDSFTRKNWINTANSQSLSEDLNAVKQFTPVNPS